MNQDQRKFLLEQVDKTYSREREILEADMPARPSLNNYMIAAFLDGTVKFNDINILKEKMRLAVLKQGSSDTLIKEHDEYSYNYNSRNNKKNDKPHTVEISAEDLFVVPAAYTKAHNEYVSAKKKIDDSVNLDKRMFIE